MVHVHPFVITTMEVEKEDTPERKIPPRDKYGIGSEYVEFAGSIEEESGDEDVAYLMDVKFLKKKEKVNWFSAVQVVEEKFVEAVAAKGKKVLACIHGYRTEPEHWLHTCWKIANTEVKTGDGTKEDFWKNQLVIPIIWPGRTVSYLLQQGIAKEAGRALALDSIKALDGLNKVSLMCHSMGNRVLMSYASVHNSKTYKKNFENVFMVAADVWEECFNDRVHKGDTYWEFGNAGWKLCQMVVGKIYICYYANDWALNLSKNAILTNKGQQRLGRYGSWPQTDTYKRCTVLKAKLEDFDMGETADRKKEVEAADPENYHSYQAAPCVVQLYYDKMNE